MPPRKRLKRARRAQARFARQTDVRPEVGRVGLGRAPRRKNASSRSFFASSAIAVFFLFAVSLGTVGGWMLGKKGIPLVPRAYLIGSCKGGAPNAICEPGETCDLCGDCGARNGTCDAGETCSGCPMDCTTCSPPGTFDLCGFATEAACQAAPNCKTGGYPDSCYYHAYSAEWCCPVGCTLQEVCGDMQVVSDGSPPDEQCDHGGGACSLGGACDTVENFKRCIAKSGTCGAPPADAFCTATCQNIPPCGNGICAGGENCKTCATDCACSSSQTCTAAGTCTGSGPPAGSSCGNGTVNSGEQCDDGNKTNGDGCSATCACEACGDGYKCATEQCDDGCLAGTPNVCEPADNGDGCSSTCVKEGTCTDGLKTHEEKQVDCGGSPWPGVAACAACPCSASNPCNDGAYCTIDTCVSGTCQYTLFNGAGNNAPCNTDYKKICVTIGNCSCNELTDRCELCSSASEALCKTTSNALCQDHGNPTGCYEKAANQWCCPGRE